MRHIVRVSWTGRMGRVGACLLVLFPALAPAQQLPVPERDPFFDSGIYLVSVLSPLTREAREERIVAEVLKGNVPAFLRDLVRVDYTAGGRNVSVWVTPDYLALGGDNDYFLIPLGGPMAQRVANALGCSMPTKLLVDKIYAAAPLKLRPQPIPASAEMITVPVFAQHNDSVRTLRDPELSSYPLGTLVGGHKKDVIISNRIYENLRSGVPKPVVIYGWHGWAHLNGGPIQPVYNGHVEWYADYSHGIRLVHDSIQVDGAWMSYRSVVADPVLNTAVSDAGAVTKPYYTSPTGADDADADRPRGFRLRQNYPNPFNPETTISYTLDEPAFVSVDMFDALGRRVDRVSSGWVSAGEHTVVWRPEVGSGTYLCRVAVRTGRSGYTTRSLPMTLIR